MLTPEQRSLRARAAALARWSREDPKESPAARRGQAGLRARFLAEVDARTPDLPEPERQRRADALYRAHMARLSLRSSRSRTQATSALADAEAAEQEIAALTSGEDGT